jgi:hypothetical protein
LFASSGVTLGGELVAWFIARITNEGDRFAVSFPDAPAIRVVHETLEGAIDAGARLLEWEICGWRAKGITPPAPTELSAMEPGGGGVSYALIEIADPVQPAAAPASQPQSLPSFGRASAG